MRYANPEYKFTSAREWHIYYVYNDPAFLKDYKQLIPYIDYRYGLLAQVNSKLSRQYADNVAYEEWLVRLAEKFVITVADIKFLRLEYDYSKGQKLNMDMRPLVNYDRKTGYVEIVVEPGIPQEDFENIWHTIQKIKAELLRIPNTRRNPVKDPRLIYAIFRARSVKPRPTYKEIVYALQDGKLLYYEGGRTNFEDEKSLAAYYNKYRPDKKGTT